MAAAWWTKRRGLGPSVVQQYCWVSDWPD